MFGVCVDVGYKDGSGGSTNGVFQEVGQLGPPIGNVTAFLPSGREHHLFQEDQGLVNVGRFVSGSPFRLSVVVVALVIIKVVVVVLLAVIVMVVTMMLVASFDICQF